MKQPSTQRRKRPRWPIILWNVWTNEKGRLLARYEIHPPGNSGRTYRAWPVILEEWNSDPLRSK